jgi:hypothetical protein
MSHLDSPGANPRGRLVRGSASGAGHGESLGEYFVRRNDHLLGYVKVIDVAASQPWFLYGQPI